MADNVASAVVTRTETPWCEEHNTRLGGPLPGRDERVLDLVHVGNTLGHIDDHVGTLGVWTEAPDLTGITGIPVVGVRKEPSSGLRVIPRSDLLIRTCVRDMCASM